MSKKNSLIYPRYLMTLLILIIFSSNLFLVKSKLTRGHKHPGSVQSTHPGIEIEPLNKNEENNILNNNIISENKEENINDSQKNTDDTPQDINNVKQSTNYYNEDDEFVYSTNNNNIDMDLDQEIRNSERRQIPNPNNFNNNINNNGKPNINNPQFDPEKERIIREQREQSRRQQQQNRYNPRPHQQRTVNQDNLNHGRHPPHGVPPSGYPHGQKTQNAQQTTTNQPSKPRKLLSLFYQIMMIFFFVSFIYNYFLGKNQNDKHALVWYNSNKEYFEERYEYFGLEDDDNLKKPKKTLPLIKDCKLIKENPYYYKLSCGNYRYIRYLTVVLEFHKRYDMTSLISSIFISPKDRIVFQVSFDQNDNVGWIFCVSRKKQSKSLRKSYEDLNYFCQVYEPSSFDNYMCLITESLEVFMELFNNKSLYHYYKAIEKYIEAIYYSDMISMYVEGNNIFFSFNIDLTRPEQERTLLEITHFVNLFVDTLAQLKYTKEFKETVKKSRIMYERTKMDPKKRKEIEDKERNDFIERWKIKRKMKNKKGAEKKRLERELNKYQ